MVSSGWCRRRLLGIIHLKGRGRVLIGSRNRVANEPLHGCLDAKHFGRKRIPQELGLSVEGLVQLLQELLVLLVEEESLVLDVRIGVVVGDFGVRFDRIDGLHIHGEGPTSRLKRLIAALLVVTPVVPALLDLIEPEQMGEFTFFVVNTVMAAFALTRDQVDSGKGGIEVDNLGQLASSGIVVLGADLLVQIAGEKIPLSHRLRQMHKAEVNRFVKVANTPIVKLEIIAAGVLGFDHGEDGGSSSRPRLGTQVLIRDEGYVVLEAIFILRGIRGVRAGDESTASSADCLIEMLALNANSSANALNDGRMLFLRPGGAFDFEKGLDSFIRKFLDADGKVGFPRRERDRVIGHKGGVHQIGRAANGIEEIASQGQVQHLFFGHRFYDVTRALVGLDLSGIRARQVDWDGGVLELQRNLQVFL